MEYGSWAISMLVWKISIPLVFEKKIRYALLQAVTALLGSYDYSETDTLGAKVRSRKKAKSIDQNTSSYTSNQSIQYACKLSSSIQIDLINCFQSRHIRKLPLRRIESWCAYLQEQWPLSSESPPPLIPQV